nr:MAG TPA: hypothetical protein [Caudoviricetes sp.]
MSVLNKMNRGMLKIKLNEKIENMYKLYYGSEESSKMNYPDFYKKEELTKIGISDENITKFQRICDDIFLIVINLEIYHYEKISENENWVTSKNTYFLKEDLENIETYNEFQEKYNLIIKKIQDFKLIYEISVILGLELKMLLEELEITLSDLLKLERKFLINETRGLQKKYQEVADKIEKTSEKNKRLTKEIEKTRKKNEKHQKEYDKRILELMGIFLSIFSVIGLGVTGILNIQDNLPTNILLIMGSILIVVTLLFALIKYDSKNKYKFWILIIFGINLILTGIFFYNPVDKNWEEAKIKIENLEKKLDYEKRINELEKKTK